MANRKKRTKKRDEALLKALRAGLSIAGAAKSADYSPTQLREYRKQDPALEQDIQDAIEVGTDLCEDEALRRGKRGVLKPVYQGGQRVGYVREFSDNLLLQLLRARRPGTWSDKKQVEHSGPGGGPIETRTGAAAEVEKQINAIAERLAKTGEESTSE